MEEFTDHPNNGHTLIHEFMLDLPEAALRKGTNPVLLRQPGEHHLCVMCLKAIMENDYGRLTWSNGVCAGSPSRVRWISRRFIIIIIGRTDRMAR